MLKYQSWISALFVLVVIAIPSMVGLFFVLDANMAYWWMFIFAIAITLGGFLITFAFYKFKVVAIETFNFSVPISIVFAFLYIARDFPWWAMLLMAIIGVITALPTNSVVANIKRKKQKNKK